MRGKRGWLKFGVLAPASTHCEPSSTSAIRDNGGHYSCRSRIRTSVGYSWCMKSACFLPRTRQPSAVAAIRTRSPPSTTTRKGNVAGCRGRVDRLSSVQGTYSDGGSWIEQQEVRSDAQVRRRRAPLTTHTPSDEPQPRQTQEKTSHGMECHDDDLWAGRARRHRACTPPSALSPTVATTAAPLLKLPRHDNRTAQARACIPARLPTCFLIQTKGCSPSTGVPAHAPRVSSARGRRARFPVSLHVRSPRHPLARPSGSIAAHPSALLHS